MHSIFQREIYSCLTSSFTTSQIKLLLEMQQEKKNLRNNFRNIKKIRCIHTSRN